MKNIKYLILSVFLLAIGLISCQQEEQIAKAVLVSESLVEIPAEGAAEVVVTVYSDGLWRTEAPEWITVTPPTGEGSMDVTLSFCDNIRDGAVDNPREEFVVFRGDKLMSHAKVKVRQDGDKFRDLSAVSFADLADLELNTFVFVDDALAVAVANNGFLALADDTYVFVTSVDMPKIGDKVSFYAYTDNLHSFVSLTNTERMTVLSSSNPVNYAENDITSSFDTFVPTAVSYITLEGVLNGNALTVNGALTAACLLYNPSEDLQISSLNGHKVKVSGFALGKETNTVYLLPVGPIIDNGVDEIIYFSDNFDWLSDLAVAAGAGDSMGLGADNNAKNAYTAVEGFADLLSSQGYEDLFPTSKTIYLQTNYLKFSKNKNVNGIRLPAITYGGTTNVVMTFDWGVHVGSGGPDEVELEIAIEGNGAVDKETFTHTEGEWQWQTETVTITGVDDNTRIVLRPSDFTGTATSSSLYKRWYLDNIKIIQGEGNAPAGDKVYFEETWDWVQPWADAYGSGDSVGDNDHSGKAPNVYTQETQAGFIDEFTKRGYVDLNPEGKVMYTQKYYMKFGKTNVHTGIILPANDFEGNTPIDVDITFDWCAHMITKEPFTHDKVKMVVELSGAGVCADSNATISNAYETKQEDGQMEWQQFSLRLNGVTKDTRISIHPLDWKKNGTDGDEYKVQRYHLDNIKIATAK